jgi:chemotaxis signal transduction protein
MVEINSSLQLDRLPEPTELLVLEVSIAGQAYAIRAECVQKVLPIAAWTVQTGLPENVVGMLQLEDQFLPVVNARVCLGFETRLPQIEDHLLLVQTNSRFLIWLDRANSLRDWQEVDMLLNLEIFEPELEP